MRGEKSEHVVNLLLAEKPKPETKKVDSGELMSERKPLNFNEDKVDDGMIEFVPGVYIVSGGDK